MTIYIPLELRKHARIISTHVMKYDAVLAQYMKENGFKLAVDIDSAIKIEMSTKIKEEIKRETGVSVDESRQIVLNYLIKSQEKLSLMAKNTTEASVELNKYLDVFFRDFERDKYMKGKEMLLNPEWQKRFTALRKRYFDFSRVVNAKIMQK